MKASARKARMILRLRRRFNKRYGKYGHHITQREINACLDRLRFPLSKHREWLENAGVPKTHSEKAAKQIMETFRILSSS